MDAVKGGGLDKLPEKAEAVLKTVHPDWSIASWSVRFCLEMEDVIAALFGMSTLEQVLDNTKTSDEAQPLTDEESAAAMYRRRNRERKKTLFMIATCETQAKAV